MDEVEIERGSTGTTVRMRRAIGAPETPGVAADEGPDRRLRRSSSATAS